MTKAETKQTLESKISAVLANPNTGSADYIEIIAETEAAVLTADEATKIHREKAMQIDNVDIRADCDAAFTAELTRDRLTNILPKLRDALTAAKADEYKARWLAERQKVEARRNTSAEHFAELEKLFSQIVQILDDAAETDRDIDRINNASPGGYHPLSHVENYCRDLANFSDARPSMRDATTLVGFNGEQLWPRHRGISTNGIAAALYSAPSHPGPRWHEQIKARDEQLARDAQKLDAFHKERERGRELNNNEIARAQQQRQR